MAEVTEGTVVDGRYRVISRIGTGGMADVWLAEDSSLNRRVALKVLHSRFAQDREFVERFRREAEAAAGLDHPNIVSVYDRGETEGSYYIAMAYLQGRSLKELIDAGLPPVNAVAYVRQILEAAGFAHRNGVIHRDLKPQNVIVDNQGKATVTDFGIARAGVSEITQTGSVMGTAHYLSPEQAQGFEVTAGSDLYSVGVILYQCLTGRVPFAGDSAVAVALQQVSQIPVVPSELNPEVSPALDAVVMKALEKDPNIRFRTADEFIAALDAAVQEPGAIPTATPTPIPASELEDEEARARRRRRNWMIAGAILAVLIGAYAAYYFTRTTSKTYDVPDVTGQRFAVAKASLEEQGFAVEKGEPVQRDAPKNQVLEQDPKGEVTKSRGCGALRLSCSDPTVTVVLSVSGGPGEGKVPSVRGLSQEEATQQIEDAGFDVNPQAQNSETVDEGIVISTQPSGGSTLPLDQSVTIIVSSGPKLVQVPAVVGRQRSAAVEALRGRNLVASVTEEDSDRPAGEVLRQSPNAGKDVAKGSTVEIVVSKGVQTISVPNVVGDLRPNAVNELRGLGLVPDVQVQDTDVQAQDGKVIDQFPSPGTTADEGTTVSLVVGHYVPAEEPTTPSNVAPSPNERTN